MAAENKATLKTYFETNDIPTEGQFVNLIDSMVNTEETTEQTLAGNLNIAGTLTASSVEADTYNVSGITILASEIDFSLTSSNQFGTSSAHIHSFSGSIHQSGSDTSYFLNNLAVGTTTSAQNGRGGLAIYKTDTIGGSNHPLSQSKWSSLLISSSDHHMAVDANELRIYNQHLYITSQKSTTGGNIYLATGDTTSTSTKLFISESGYVGVNRTTPKYAGNTKFETTGSVTFTGDSVYLTIDDYDDGTFVAGTTGSRIISRDNNIMIWNGGLSVGQYTDNALVLTGSGELTVKNKSRLLDDVYIGGDVSASGNAYISATDANGSFPNVLTYDTTTGRLYYTGSYGTGGGGGSDNWYDGSTYLSSSVNVGVKMEPSNYEFEVAGTIAATGDVIAYSASDRRLKDNIKPIENPLEKLKKIGGYSFEWNDKQDIFKGKDFGVIAQEIEEVLPELVQTRDNGYKAVKYDKIVSLLIEAIKEQQVQIDELKKYHI